MRNKMRTLIERMTLSNSARRQKAWMLAAFLGWMLLGSDMAAAQSCTGAAESITVQLPATATVARDAPNGTTLLTNWFSAGNNSYFVCRGSDSGSGMGFRPHAGLTKSGMMVNTADGTYTVWNTDVPGIGIAIAVRTFANGCGLLAWQDLGHPNSGAFPPGWVGRGCNERGTVRNGGWVRVALVKTGSATGGTVTGTVTGSSLLEGASMTRANGAIAYTPGTSNMKTFGISPIRVTVAACTTEPVPVPMGSYPQSVFKGKGLAASPVSFNVLVNACPAGLNSVQYQFVPVNAVLDPANGVLALSNDSTATGIGLQLKDSNDTAVQYNKQYTLTAYSKATGGSYSIPLRAAYYQTADTVTPGSANAMLTFTMTYQ
ncbi:fimbrial protein [Achromobacter sp. Bel]|uniref:fimbrial protein n=1 Tax=Achromobacter sp. Bel TaxID=2727415 RepID=UPI00145E57FF|nr:fimbrial protein [Achromobacter sp. Bel]NMK47212.1 type 1 fimbrial protein [Achromobacter sp. Bel]